MRMMTRKKINVTQTLTINPELTSRRKSSQESFYVGNANSEAPVSSLKIKILAPSSDLNSRNNKNGVYRTLKKFKIKAKVRVQCQTMRKRILRI